MDNHTRTLIERVRKQAGGMKNTAWQQMRCDVLELANIVERQEVKLGSLASLVGQGYSCMVNARGLLNLTYTSPPAVMTASGEGVSVIRGGGGHGGPVVIPDADNSK